MDPRTVHYPFLDGNQCNQADRAEGGLDKLAVSNKEDMSKDEEAMLSLSILWRLLPQIDSSLFYDSLTL